MIRRIWMQGETTALRLIVKRLIVRRGGYQCRTSGKLYLKDMEFSLHKRQFVYGLQYTTKWGSGRISSPTAGGIVQILRGKLNEWEAKKCRN